METPAKEYQKSGLDQLWQTASVSKRPSWALTIDHLLLQTGRHLLGWELLWNNC